MSEKQKQFLKSINLRLVKTHSNKQPPRLLFSSEHFSLLFCKQSDTLNRTWISPLIRGRSYRFPPAQEKEEIYMLPVASSSCSVSLNSLQLGVDTWGGIDSDNYICQYEPTHSSACHLKGSTESGRTLHLSKCTSSFVQSHTIFGRYQNTKIASSSFLFVSKDEKRWKTKHYVNLN